MGDKTLLLADGVHINPRNFGSLLSFVSARNVDIVRDKKTKLPIDAFGQYAPYQDVIDGQIQSLAPYDAKALYGFEYRGINVFSVCRAETLSLLITTPAWMNEALPDNSRSLFELMHERDEQVLRSNMAAAMFWIDHWRETPRKTPRLSYIGVFSGSLIYARALLEVAKFWQGRAFVFESFFTGKHYYCEERFDPIANRSDVRLPTVYKGLAVPTEPELFDSARTAALKAVEQSCNKNVTQPDQCGKRVFDNGKKTVLVLGQVLNDFSLLEYNNVGLGSIDLYQRLIQTVLEQTDLNVIFKAHPWEQQKSNLFKPATLNAVTKRFGENNRMAILEDHNLGDLLQEVDCVTCINSQSGIEAALAGFKPIQFGRAFWGQRGFTHDLEPTNMDDFLDVLRTPSDWRLRLDEYDSLSHWLIAMLDSWLIQESTTVSSTRRLSTLFYEIAPRKPKAAAKAPSKTKLATANVSPVAAAPASTQRKVRKLLRDPEAFFRDARNPSIRKVGSLLRGH